jgi:hypothetical protein
MGAASIPEWLIEDAKDDYFPDPVGFRDLALFDSQVEINLEAPAKKGIEAIPIPKNALFQRMAFVLPPDYRILYMRAVGAILPALSKHFFARCRAFGPDQLRQRYPFSGGTARWIGFNAEFREQLERSRGWGVVTDVTSYFDHINRQSLVARISNAVGDENSKAVSVISFCLGWLKDHTRGIPQNNDISSFLGNFYLSPADAAADGIDGIFLRYSDDIRIVTKSRAAAIDGFSAIHNSLRSMGLFLNSAKTELIQPGTDRWYQYLDGSRDQALGEIDSLLSAENGPSPRIHDLVLSGLRNAKDVRSYRAFANRALKSPKSDALRNELDEAALRGFYATPEAADLWVKCLSNTDSNEKAGRLVSLLLADDYNRNTWVNCRAISWIGKSGTESGTVIDHLRSATRNSKKHWLERTEALLALGQLGVRTDDDALKLISDAPFDHSCRCAVVAAWKNNDPLRTKVIEKAQTLSPFVGYLVRYLSTELPLLAADQEEAPSPQRRTKGRIGGTLETFHLPVGGGGSDYE